MRRLAVVIGVLVIVTGIVFRVRLRGAWQEWRQPKLPPAVALINRVPAPTTSAAPVAAVTREEQLPDEVNWDVPFTSQAPHANWDAVHEEFCEEAAVLMAGRYFSRRGIASKNEAETALQALKARELELFGYFADTTAAETARLLEDQYPVSASLLTDPTTGQLQRGLAAGQLVLVPSAGRQLRNPNFKTPGPLYHMLVLKGYTTRGEFITNDPGTRKGADYVYPFERVMTAMHDWNGGEVENGAKVVIVVAAKP